MQSVDFDIDEWNVTDNHSYFSPQQGNGFDCGVYVLMCTDFLCDNIPLDIKEGNHYLAISPNNMPYFRMKIAADILRGNLKY